MPHFKRSPVAARVAALLLLLALSLFARLTHAGFFDPAASWKTIQTPHFNIHFPKALEPAAQRLAVIAEKVHAELSPRFDWKPWGRTEVILTDQTDQSNGFTTVLPYNYVLLYAVPPTADSTLNSYDHWLEDLFRHEYAHVLHLDMNGKYVKPLRYVFGKLISPNGLTPRWVREGIAVQQESLTGKGRANNSLGEMFLRTDIANGEFLKIDQMDGQQFEWPGSQAAYLYGGKFWSYLAETYGQDKIADFSHRYSNSWWLFSLNDKAKATFAGKSFFELRREWKKFLEEKYAVQKRALEVSGFTPLETVKKIRGVVENPTWSPDGKILFYSRQDYHNAPEIRAWNSETNTDERLLRHARPSGLSVSPDGKFLAYNQIHTHKKYYQFSDLYQIDLSTKKTQTLTSGLRAYHPDFSPDGKQIVFVNNLLLGSQLSLLDTTTRETRPLTPAESELQFSNPRFSPDGRSVAVSVWKQGQRDLYLYDLNGKMLRQLTNDAALDLEPTFSADGKSLVFSSDRNGIFNLYRLDLASGKSEATSHVFTGLFEPARRGDAWYAKHYFGRGYELVRLPSTDLGSDSLPKLALTLPSSKIFEDLEPNFATNDSLPVKKYNPFKKLFIPRYLMPGVLFTDTFLFSLSTGSQDPLGRHNWIGDITYRPDANFFGGDFYYTYRRFWPTLYFGAQDYAVNFGDIFRNGGNYFEERRRAFVGSTIDAQFHGAHQLSGYYFFENQSAESAIPADAERVPTLGNLSGFGLNYRYSRARQYPASISLEGGPRLMLNFEASDSLLGSSQNHEQIIFSGDLREYVPLPLDGHVLAFRLAGGIAWGDRLLQGTFRLGSADGEGTLTAVSPRLFTLRGLPQITFAGEKALLASGEYRLPLIDPQRGWGTGPIFLSKLYLNFFTDYGSVFNGGLNFDRFLLGVGTEVRADLVLGYGLPVTGRLGYGVIVLGREFIEGLRDPLTRGAVKNGALILELGTSF